MANTSNVSRIDLKEEQWNYFVTNGIPVFVFLVIVCFGGIIGNAHAFVVYFFRFTASNHRTFICWLSVVDFMACSFGVPLLMFDTLRRYTFYSTVLCKFYVSFFFFASPYSLLLFNLIAVERYRKICRPLGWQVSLKQSFRACIVIGICASFLIIPPAMMYASVVIETPLHNTGFDCTVMKSYRDTSLLKIFYGLSLVIIIGALINCIVLYILIGRALMQQESLIPKFKQELSLEEKLEEYRKSIDFQEVKTFPKENVSCDNSVDDLDAEGLALGLQKDQNGLDVDGYGITLNMDGGSDAKCHTLQQHMHYPVLSSNLQSSTEVHSSSVVINPMTLIHDVEIMKDEDTKQYKQTSFADDADLKIEGTSNLRSLAIKRRSRKKRNRIRRSRVITRMFLVSSILSCAVYLPFEIFSIIQRLDDDAYRVLNNALRSSIFLIERLYLLNHVLNPVVYCALDTRFRKQCKIMYHLLYNKVHDFFTRITCRS